MTELPRYARFLDELAATRPELAAAARPYLDHLLDWDFRSSLDSTQATLAVEWYEELYGRGYPVETLEARVRLGPPGALRRAGARRANASSRSTARGRFPTATSTACSATPSRPTPPPSRSTTRNRASRSPACAARSVSRSRSTTRRRSTEPPPEAAHARTHTQAPLRHHRRLLHGGDRVPPRRRQGGELSALRAEPRSGVAALLRSGEAPLGAPLQAGMVRLGRRAWRTPCAPITRARRTGASQ